MKMIEENRRKELFEDMCNFFDQTGGIDPSWQEAIDNICPDDSFDALDICVGKICVEWGGTLEAREFLESIGATEDEVETLIDEDFDFYF